MDPESPTEYPPPPMPRPAGRSWTIAAFALAVAAILLLPIVFGPAAVVVGVIGLRKGDPLGRWAAIAGVVATAFGIIVAAMLVDGDPESALLVSLLAT